MRKKMNLKFVFLKILRFFKKFYGVRDLSFVFIFFEKILKDYYFKKNSEKIGVFPNCEFFKEFFKFLFKKIFIKKEFFQKFSVLKFLILLKKFERKNIVLDFEFNELIINTFEMYNENLERLLKKNSISKKFFSQFEYEYFYMVNLLKNEILQKKEIWNFFPKIKEENQKIKLYQNFYCEEKKRFSRNSFLNFHLFLFLQKRELISNYFSEFYTLNRSIAFKNEDFQNLEFFEIYLNKKKKEQAKHINFFLHIGNVQLLIVEKSQENKNFNVYLNIKYKFFKIKLENDKINIYDQTNKTKISIFFSDIKNVKEIFELIFVKKKIFFLKEKEFLENRLKKIKEDVLARYKM